MRLHPAALVVAVLLALPSAAHAAFTSSVQNAPPRATMLGDDASDVLVFNVEGGVLTHFRKSYGNPGFASDTDFVTGDGQTVTTRPPTTAVTVNAGGGADFLEAQPFAGSLALDGGPGTDTFQHYAFDFPEPREYTLLPTALLGVAGGARTFTSIERVTVLAGDGVDRLDVPGPVGMLDASFDSGAGADTVVLRDGVELGGRFNGGPGSDTIDATSRTQPVVADLGEVEIFFATGTGTGAVPQSAATYYGAAAVLYHRATNGFDLNLSTTATAGQLTGSRLGLGAPDTPDSAITTVLDTGADPDWQCEPCMRDYYRLGLGDRLADLRSGRMLFLLTGTAGNVRAPFRVSFSRGTATGVGGTSSVENVLGGAGDDMLLGAETASRLDGNAGDDVLAGTGGADTLDGGPGRDAMSGGDGDDTIGAADGGIDRIRCGSGTDTVAADDVDDVGADCENVTRAATPPPPPPAPPGSPQPPPTVVERPAPLTDATFAATFLQTRGGATVKPGARVSVARDGSSLVLVAVCHSTTPCRTDQRLFLGKGAADPFAARLRPAPAARSTLVVPAGEARTATIRLTAAGRRALARARGRRSAATLAIRTTDDAARRQQSTTALTLVGPRPRRRR